jgi:hypothetical protein
MRMGKIAAAALVLLATGSTALAQVQLSIRDGRVTLVAKDATVRQILAEWARVGQTRIINAERMPGGPITMQLTDAPEEQALDLLLRNVSGYVAAPRAAMVSTLSRYDRILVMPTAAAARQPLVAAASVSPVAQRPVVSPSLDNNSDDEPVTGNVPATTVVTPPRGPVFTTFQQPQSTGAQPPVVGGPGAAQPMPVPNGGIPDTGAPSTAQPPLSSPTPSAPSSPAGVPRPGMIIQPQTPAPGRLPQ